mmetsp:Transcript_9357/g.22202  ORF Transcript_9357/g.22202 Transcript_9357/m.22202 type:complete len:245 (-) Transcript_9357:131-865(-)
MQPQRHGHAAPGHVRSRHLGHLQPLRRVLVHRRQQLPLLVAVPPPAPGRAQLPGSLSEKLLRQPYLPLHVPLHAVRHADPAQALLELLVRHLPQQQNLLRVHPVQVALHPRPQLRPLPPKRFALPKLARVAFKHLHRSIQLFTALRTKVVQNSPHVDPLLPGPHGRQVLFINSLHNRVHFYRRLHFLRVPLRAPTRPTDTRKLLPHLPHIVLRVGQRRHRLCRPQQLLHHTTQRLHLYLKLIRC